MQSQNENEWKVKTQAISNHRRDCSNCDDCWGQRTRDRRSMIAHTRTREAIEQRMIQFIRPMSLSGATPCRGVRRATAEIGFDLTPRVLLRITH